MSIALDTYELELPRDMRSYLRAYGYHFNKRACEYAVKNMRRMNPATGKKEPVEYMNKDAVEELLKKHSIKLDHNEGHDFVYAANMIKADYWKSSIEDEAHMAKMIKDIIDDPDNPGGNLFRKYLVDCDAKGVGVEWSEIL